MYNSLLLDANDSVVADRLARIQDALRALTLSTREDYQAAVYSMVNQVINLGDTMQPLDNIRSRPAVVGDLTGNLTKLNQDAGDIAAELLRIENNAGDLYNLAAASQNALRQLIRKMIYTPNQKQLVIPFIDDSPLQAGYTATLDFNAGVASLPLASETVLSPTITVGLASDGKALTPIANLTAGKVGTSFQWQGTVLELVLSFPAAVIVNRLVLDLDTYEGIEITTLTSSPDGQISNDVLSDLGVSAIVLDARSGKFSGDGIVDFPPRLVKQMRLVIESRAGQPLFGLRALKAFSRTYQDSGVLTSQPIEMSGSAVSFSTDELTTSPFSTITHQISTDGVHFSNISTGLLGVTGRFWYKAVLNRSASAFNQAGSSLTPLASSSAVNAAYTVKSQSTRPLDNGMVEQTIVLANVTGPVVFQDAPLPNSFRVQSGAFFLRSGLDFTLNGTVVSFAQTQTLVTLTFQTSALGSAALASLKPYYSPFLYESRFQAA